MSELLTRKNRDTGETIQFQWDESKPPTADQIDEIARQRLDAKIEAQRKISSSEPGIIDRVLASKPFDAFRGVAEAAGFNQPWHPLDSAAQVGAGVSQMWSGEGPEQHPRVAGAVKAVKGTMGMIGPPATALGYAVAPIPMAAGMIGGNLASKGAAALTPEDYSPEVKEAIQTGAGLAAGGLIGGGVARAMRPSPISSPISPSVKAPGVEVLPPLRPGNFRSGPPDLESVIMDMGPRRLPPPSGAGFPGGPEFPVRPPMGPPQQLPPGDVLPPFNYAQPQDLPAGPQRLALPERSPIELPPASIPMPPAGTYEAGQAAQSRVAWGEENLAPMGRKALPPPQDIVSTKVEPLSPSEVSTVSPTEGSSPKVENKGGGVEPSPSIPVQPSAPQPPMAPPASSIAAAAMRKAYGLPDVPAPPPAPPQVPIAPVAPPEIAPQIEAPPAAPSMAARAIAASRGPLVPPIKPDLGPVKPIEITKPAEVVRPSLPIEEPLPEPTPPEESELTPVTQKKVNVSNDVLDFMKRRKDVRISDIQTKFGTSADQTLDILRDFSKRGLVTGKLGRYNYVPISGEGLLPPPKIGNVGPVRPPIGNVGPLANTAAPPSEISETPKPLLDQISTGTKNPKLIKAASDYIKKNPDATAEQLGEHLRWKFVDSGYSQTAYTSYAHPFVKEPPTPVRTEIPIEESRVPSYAKPNTGKGSSLKTPESGVSPARQARIKSLQDEIESATQEGDKQSAKTLQVHLDSEMKNAQIEKTGTITQKKILIELDNVSNRVDDLENKSERSALSNVEQAELDGLYRKLNTLEQKRDYALKPDIEKYGPRVANMRSVHAEGTLSGMSHEQLSTRAKTEFGVDSMSKLTPEQLAQFEDGLKTERLEKEAEIQDLEEKQLEEDLSPTEKSRLLELMKGESGTSNMMEGLRNVANLISAKGPGKGALRKGWAQSGETVLRREGGESVIEDIRSARTEGEKLAGRWVADYHDNIKGMNKAEAENLLAVIQGTVRAINPKVADAARIENTRLKSVLARLGKQKVNIDPVTTTRTDRAVLSDFYTNAGKKIGEFEDLGKRVRPKGENIRGIPEEIHRDIQAIKTKGGDYRTAYKVADAYFNPNRMTEAEQAIWDKMSNFEVSTKLGLSVISNATQPVNVALVTGNYTFLKALAKEITNFDAAKNLALRSGSTLSSVTHESQLTAGVTPHSFGGKMLEVTGFSPIEVHNRILASMAGAEHSVAMFKKLKADPKNVYARRHLKNWLGLDPDVLVNQQKLTMDQVMTAAHTLSDKTQFRTTPLEVPYKWGSSLEARMVTLFKNFAFNQAKFMKDVVINEMKAGNLRPLIPLLTTVPLLGTLADRLKKLISGKNQPEAFWDSIIGAYTSVGGVGIISDLAARAAIGKLADAVLGPIAGDAIDFVESIFKAGQSGSTKPVAKEVIRKVPVVGRPITNRVYPPVEKKAPRSWMNLPRDRNWQSIPR